MTLSYPAPSPYPRPTVAIGNFDGVHAGHVALLQAARALGGPLLALTFEPHPRTVVRPGATFVRLMTAAEKIERLAALVDEVAVLPFDATVAEWHPADFMQRILVEWLDAGRVVVGENFGFGHKAAGTAATLAAHPGFATTVVPLATDAAGVVFSSSRLRENS